jgi:hypothetical protein
MAGREKRIDDMGKPERTVLVIGIVVLLLVAVSASVTIAFGSPEVAEFPADSPEATVQRYLEAAYAGDVATMEQLLSERVRNDRNDDPFSPTSCTETEDRIVSVDRVTVEGEAAVVILRIEQFDASLFGSGSSDWQQETRLVREAEGWKIDDAFFCV